QQKGAREQPGARNEPGHADRVPSASPGEGPLEDRGEDRAEIGPADQEGPPTLIHALDGFLGAGSASRLAGDAIRSEDADVVYQFDIDRYYDYRARRPAITFDADHYTDYVEPCLELVRDYDELGNMFYLLSGPEPDFGWEQFVSDAEDIIDDLGVGLTLGMAAVPVGVPHTRPMGVTAHGVRPALVARTNMMSAQVQLPPSAPAPRDSRLGQAGHAAAGHVVHAPPALAQIEFPTAGIALVDAVATRTGLSFDDSGLRDREQSTLEEIAKQIEDQDGTELLSGLEEQYDSF